MHCFPLLAQTVCRTPHTEGFASLATGDHGQGETRGAANYWLPLLGQRAGVRRRLLGEGLPPRMKARGRIPPPKAVGAALPSPQPSPRGEGASSNALAASVRWGGLWPLCQLLEEPLPVSRRAWALLAIASFLLVLESPKATAAADRPNILVIITDDQGYGDLGIHDNPKIKTPNLDRFARQSVRLKSFYVSPVCAPTRASLLTGRYNYRTGVVDTYQGRAMMHPDEVTLAEILATAGYRTGIFGKWHLGDNAPLRHRSRVP